MLYLKSDLFFYAPSRRCASTQIRIVRRHLRRVIYDAKHPFRRSPRRLSFPRRAVNGKGHGKPDLSDVRSPIVFLLPNYCFGAKGPRRALVALDPHSHPRTVASDEAIDNCAAATITMPNSGASAAGCHEKRSNGRSLFAGLRQRQWVL